jgi:predicted Fe-Mo cluster-binding NifX family protein
MKLAFSTDDGKTISRHFGRATHYLVIELVDGKIAAQELRQKPGHNQFLQEGGHDHQHDDHDHEHAGHGYGKRAQDRHTQMFAPISDCAVIVSGGMGSGAYHFLQSQGLQPILTGLEDIPSALQAYLDGTLENRVEWLH